ncbi:MAG: nucleoside triphosphate pyrophosphohydrolase [Chromatiales bacterium]|jgi:MazG family protein|nr:nucleoside triphosphate pyrophosphohydrolase [Chromatiales bacterium]MDX9766057.1 nucleoside triphosphate pyrophosphohydrolase [Ectothiorhodospiraceae bacterium]
MESITRLLDLMAQLRDPARGCPWDVKQTFASIAPHTIEEAYEVVDAIEREDHRALCDELGDLLLQVVFHAQMAREQALFDFDAVARGLTDKLVRRHPHVFGDVNFTDETEQHAAWEAVKAEERTHKGEGSGALDGVARSLPALLRAVKLQKRAARVGFDWPEVERVIDKIEEELEEVRHEVIETRDRDRCEDEIGDLLFAVVNLARHMDVDPEAALRRTNHKFETRFRYIETALAREGREAATTSLEDMETLWVEAKGVERAG